MKRSTTSIGLLLAVFMLASMVLPAAAAPGTRVAFTTQPAGAVAGTAFTSPPVVTVQDGTGATDTTYTANVTVAITPSTGTAGAILTGTTTVAAVAGVATFAGLSINLVGTGYTLTATSSNLTSAVSAAFNVSQPPPPASPSGLYVNVINSGQVELHWTDNSGTESGFNVERAPDIGGLGPGTYAHVGATPTVLANVTVCTDATVAPKTAYWYRVKAVNASGSSFPSNEVRVLTSVSGPQITLMQPANSIIRSGAANAVSANTTVYGTTITSAEYQLVAADPPGTFNAKDIYAGQMDLTILAPRAATSVNNTMAMPAGMPAGSVAEFEIRGTVAAVNTASGVWTIGSVVAGHPEYTQPFTVYESMVGAPQSTWFVGSRHPVVGDGVKVVAYRNAAGPGPLIAKEIRYMAPAQPPGAPALTLSFLVNGTVQSIDGPVTAPGYLTTGETWTVGGVKFRIDSPAFPAYIDSNVDVGIGATVRFATPPGETNIARQIFNQVTTAIQTTTNINTVFDTTPVPLNVPEGTWLYVIVDGVVSGLDLVTGTWTIGNEQVMCYQSAQTLLAPATVGDEVLVYARRTLTPGPLVIEQLHNILPGPLVQPYKETAVEVHLMYNGTVQAMGVNTWTIAGPAGNPVTFIVDDPEGTARIDPMPLAGFSIGSPVTVEFDHVGEVLPDPANWSPMTQSAGSNVWTGNIAPPAVPANQSGRFFLRATDARQQSTTTAYPATLTSMPTATPNAPTLNSVQQTGTGSVTVTWTAAAAGDAATDFIIERTLSTAPTSFAQVGTSAASLFLDNALSRLPLPILVSNAGLSLDDTPIS